MTRPAIVLILLSELICLLDCAAQSVNPPSTAPAPKFTLGPDTTVITSPLNSDGTPNYLAAINAQQVIGVTPANNAAIPLLCALGPAFITPTARPQIYSAFHMEPLPDNGPYFMDLDTFVRQHDKPATLDALWKSEGNRLLAPWNPTDYPIVATWLQANDKTLTQIIAASHLPRFYVPWIWNQTPPSLTKAPLTLSLGNCNNITNALITRAMLEVHDSQIPAACSDLDAVHRLARLEAQDPILITHVVAIAAETRAFHAQQAILHSNTLTPQQSRTLLTNLRALPEIASNSPLSLTVERFIALDLAMSAIRGREDIFLHDVCLVLDPNVTIPPTSLAQTDWNIMLRAINHHFDALDVIKREPLASRRAALFEELFSQDRKIKLPQFPWANSATTSSATQPAESVEQRNHRYVKELAEFLTRGPTEAIPDYSKRIAALLWQVSYERALILCDRATAEQRLTTLAAALAAYHADHNAYPESLRSLENPDYLPVPPLDPFSGKSYIYRTTPTGCILYSVGDNGIDDGGKDHKAGADDIVFQMP